MNEETFSQLTYGTIIKIKDKTDSLSKDLFFISYICRDYIDVISNTDLQTITFVIENGQLKYNDDIVIDEIIVYYRPSHGYAQINSLLPGTPISITFVDGGSFDIMNGVITELENDMITVKNYETQELYYIDFEYAGLDKKRIIRIEKTNEEYNNSEYQEEDGNVVHFYNMKEQVMDYIYKMRNKGSHVLNEVEKYKQLIEEYTDLEKGEEFNGLHENQALESMVFLNDSLFHPLSTYVENESYKEDENDDEESTIPILSQIQHAKTLKDKMNFMNNLYYDNDKNLSYHRKIKPIRDTTIWFSKVYEDDLPLYSRRLDKGVITMELSPPIILINGILFHSCEKIKQRGNIQRGESLLLKTIQSLYQKIGKKSIKIKMKEQASFCDSDVHTLYSLKTKEKWQIFMNKSNVTPQKIYDVLKEHKDVSLYDVIRKLSIIDMHKIHLKDIGWCMRNIQKNTQTLKQDIKEKKVEWNSMVYEPYVFQHFSELYRKLCKYYNEATLCQVGHPSEIIHAHHIDHGVFAMYEYVNQNNHLKLNMDDPDVSELITSINDELKKVENEDFPLKTQLHVKTYETLEELQRDNGKLILKDPEQEFKNPVKYLYSHLQSQKEPYNDSIELFNKKLQTILSTYSSTMEETELDTIQNELFPKKKDLFNILITKLIELQVREQDQCYVKDTNEQYIYSNKQWVLLSKHEEKLRKKKVLRIQNTNKDFQQTKETMLNDYVLHMVQQMHNERNIESEKQEHYMKNKQITLRRQLLQLKNNKIRKVLKYNTLKQMLEKTFDLNEYLATIKPSPYFGMLYDILSIEDLNEKYTMIHDFIRLLTVDNGDKDWYFCALTNTKLIPKFLEQLSDSYLTNDNYEQTIKTICIQEGTLSESGDAWIHKKSGIMIQPIYFDTNYGYDENGFKITLDAIKEKDTSEIKKEVILSPEESRIVPLIRALSSFMKIRFEILSTSFGSSYNTYVKEIYKIYKSSLSKPTEINVHKNKCYAILGFLLAYVQCNHVAIQDTFAGCIQSFEGYPLQQSQDNLNGILYISCILYKISQKNPNPPYVSLKKLKQDDILREFCSFIRNFVMKNPSILSMVMKKRQVHEYKESYDSAHTSYISLQGFTKFYPSLKEIKLKQNKELERSSRDMQSLSEYHKIQDRIMFQNMRLQEFIQKNMKGEKPLLTTKTGHPFLINTCCNEGDFILKHLCKSKTEKEELKQIKGFIEEYDEILFSLKQLFILPKSLSIIKSKDATLIANTMIQSLNDQNLIYAYMIHYGNFDNNVPISAFLSSIIQEKPNASYYHKHESLDMKIASLRENGYIYDVQHLILAMQLQARTNAKKLVPQNINTTQTIHDEIVQQVNDYLQIDLTDKNVEEIMTQRINDLKINIHKYTISTLVTSDHQLSKIEDYLDTFIITTQNEHFLVFLKQCNEALLGLIPQILLSGKNPIRKHVLCEHWDLASKHKDTLVRQHQETFKMFESLQAIAPSSEYDFLNILQSMKSILKIDIFKHNPSVQFTYELYVFYRLLDWYTMFDLNSKVVGSNDSFIKKCNKSIYSYLYQIKKYHNTEYSYAKTMNKQLKESEKHLIISSFEDMTEENRSVENTKKILGLGKWSYGKGKQVFKYYKDSYEDEEKRANEVKNTMMNMYNEENSRLFHDNIMEMDEDEQILHEEQDNLIYEEEDDRINEEGELIEE